MIPIQSSKKTPALFVPVETQHSGVCIEGPCRPTHDQIERRAYEIYVTNGRSEGHCDQDWCHAERQLSAYSEAPSFQRPESSASF